MSRQHGSLSTIFAREIPGWTLHAELLGGFYVRSPTFELDGMLVWGRDPEEVIERVRTVEAVWAEAIAAGRQIPGWGLMEDATDERPTKPFLRLNAIPADLVLPVLETQEAGRKPKGSAPDAMVCPNCDLPAFRQDGACQVCAACGHKVGGCSD